MVKNKKSNKNFKRFPTVDLKSEKEIAMDFAVKAYRKFDKMIKAVALFGSSAKNSAASTSDVDIIIIIDDASIVWDQELIAWYREELGKLVASNPYKKELHITTTKITTFWNDLLKGDPLVVNVLRYGEALVDVGGFFNPLKALLQQGRVRISPEAIYTALQRAPEHFRRSKLSTLNAVEGLFWAMVDSSQAALMATKVSPPSPEHIISLLKENFVDKNMLKMKYVLWYRDLYMLHRSINHQEVSDIKGAQIDEWQSKTDEFISVMAKLVKDVIEKDKIN
ncbi:MAG: nucleotidyltransferase domain-containing protein [Nanoarchaeota archaeon]|mgnify:CR=1 FL=1